MPNVIERLVNKIPYYSIYNCLMIKVNSKFPIKIAAFKKPDRNEKIIIKNMTALEKNF